MHWNGEESWFYDGPIVIQILPGNAEGSTDYTEFIDGSREMLAELRLGDSEEYLEKAESYCDDQDFERCIDHAQLVEFGEENINQAKELLRRGHLGQWGDRIGERQAWYETAGGFGSVKTRFQVRRMDVRREFSNTNQNRHFRKANLSAPDGYRWVIIRARETNLDNEIGAATKHGGLLDLRDYTLHDHFGNSYRAMGSISDDFPLYFHRRYTRDGQELYYDVGTDERWDFNLIYEVPDEIPGEALYLETPNLEEYEESLLISLE